MYFSSFFPQPFATFFPSFFKKSELIKKFGFTTHQENTGIMELRAVHLQKSLIGLMHLKPRPSLLREAKLLPPSYPNNNNHHPINKLLPLPLRELKAYWEDLIAQEL